MGRIAISVEKCNGCAGREYAICVDDCPTDVLRLRADDGKAYVAYPIDCTTCYLCQKGCPTHAIRVFPDATRIPILIY